MYHRQITTWLATEDRLALIIPPARPKNVKARAKKLVPRRNVSTLKNFLDLPLDIIYEVRGGTSKAKICLTVTRRLLTWSHSICSPLHACRKSFEGCLCHALRSQSGGVSSRKRLTSHHALRISASLSTRVSCSTSIAWSVCLIEYKTASNLSQACASTRGIIQVDFKTRLRFCATCAKAK